MKKNPFRFFKKISHYSFGEKYQLIKYAVGSILANGTPWRLVRVYNFINNLIGQGIEIRKIRGGIAFDYPVGPTQETFELKIQSSDAFVFEQILIDEEYKPVLSLFSSLSISPHVMIDAGANIGLTSRYFHVFYPEMKIIALEPNEETFRRLQQMIKLGKPGDIHLLKKGLWSAETLLGSDNSFKDGEDWSFRLTEAKEKESATFATTTVQAIIEHFQITEIDFLKIDIEGGEVELFRDHSKLDWLKKVKVIALEIHDHFQCRENIENILSKSFKIIKTGELTICVNRNLSES